MTIRTNHRAVFLPGNSGFGSLAVGLMLRLGLGFVFVFGLGLGGCTPKAPRPSNLPTMTSPAVLAKNAPAQVGKPTVLLISIDGFRHDYLQKYAPPNLVRFAGEGTRAEGLVPIYPSLTFPNHYSIITGLTAEHHGLVANHFYDPVKDREYSMTDAKAVEDGTWYGGVPLWSAAEKQGMVTASYYWVASAAEIAGARPTYWLPYEDSTPHAKRIAKVMEWLRMPDENRPHFITLYFSTVDHAGHHAGPDSNEVRDAVLNVDRDLGTLFEQLKSLANPVDVIIVSDHGMVAVDRTHRGVPLDGLVDRKDFRIYEGGAQMLLYARSPARVAPTFERLKKAEKHFHVYRKADIPERFHFRDNANVPDLLVDAELPWSLGFKKELAKAGLGGTHGYDPENAEMHGIFFARGPHIAAGKVIPAFRNVNIYPFVIALLGLQLPQPVDGDLKVLAPVLKP